VAAPAQQRRVREMGGGRLQLPVREPLDEGRQRGGPGSGPGAGAARDGERRDGRDGAARRHGRVRQAGEVPHSAERLWPAGGRRRAPRPGRVSERSGEGGTKRVSCLLRCRTKEEKMNN
jgi:hypothetical protein